MDPWRGQPTTVVALNAHAFGEIGGRTDASRHVSDVVFGPSDGRVHVPTCGLRIRPKVVRPTAVKVQRMHGWHGASSTREHGQVNAKFIVDVRVQQAKVDEGARAVLVGRDGHGVAVEDGPEQFGTGRKFGFDAHVRPTSFLDVADASAPTDGWGGPLRNQRRSKANVIDEPVIAAGAGSGGLVESNLRVCVQGRARQVPTEEGPRVVRRG